MTDQPKPLALRMKPGALPPDVDVDHPSLSTVITTPLTIHRCPPHVVPIIESGQERLSIKVELIACGPAGAEMFTAPSFLLPQPTLFRQLARPLERPPDPQVGMVNPSKLAVSKRSSYESRALRHCWLQGTRPLRAHSVGPVQVARCLRFQHSGGWPAEAQT